MFAFWVRFFRACWPMAVPLVLTLIVSTAVFCTGHQALSRAISGGGTVMALMLTAIVITWRERK